MGNGLKYVVRWYSKFTADSWNAAAPRHRAHFWGSGGFWVGSKSWCSSGGPVLQTVKVPIWGVPLPSRPRRCCTRACTNCSNQGLSAEPSREGSWRLRASPGVVRVLPDSAYSAYSGQPVEPCSRQGSAGSRAGTAGASGCRGRANAKTCGTSGSQDLQGASRCGRGCERRYGHGWMWAWEDGGGGTRGHWGEEARAHSTTRRLVCESEQRFPHVSPAPSQPLVVPRGPSCPPTACSGRGLSGTPSFICISISTEAGIQGRRDSDLGFGFAVQKLARPLGLRDELL